MPTFDRRAARRGAVVAALLVTAGLPSLAEEPARLAEQLAAIRAVGREGCKKS